MNSVPRRCFDLIADNHQILLSGELRAELADVLVRRKFDQFATLERRMSFLTLLPPALDDVLLSDLPRACRDPDDEIILATAIAGRADVIISGDRDLLVLSPFEGIQILTPATFLT